MQVHIQAAALVSGVGGRYVRLAHRSVGKPELGVHADCHYTERLPRGALSALRPPPRLPQHAAHAGTTLCDNPLQFTILLTESGCKFCHSHLKTFVNRPH